MKRLGKVQISQTTGRVRLPVGGETIIRPARSDDFPGWRALWLGYNAFYGRAEQSAPSEHVIETTWKRILDPVTPVHALVAERGGRLAGLAHFVLHLNTLMVAPTCYLQDLFTREEDRGAGLGRALIDGVRHSAAELGAQGVYWHTQASNRTARGLYDKVAQDTGFVVYRTAPGGAADPIRARPASGHQD